MGGYQKSPLIPEYLFITPTPLPLKIWATFYKNLKLYNDPVVFITSTAVPTELYFLKIFRHISGKLYLNFYRLSTMLHS